MNLANIEYQDKLRQYVLQMRPMFKPNALFSDETANYVTPMEPDPGDIVTIRFRTWKDNVDKVYLVSNDRHLAMEYEKSEGDFDYFKIRLVMQEESVRYFFEIHAGKIRCFYNKIGVSRDRLDVYDFTIAPGFHTPEWAKGAVMYQIFVDRFSSGDTNNTVEDCEYYYIGDYSRKVTDWRKNPSFMGVREFYGGDLQGVMNKLDYLQDLGVDVIYFNPIFVSPSNHKYDIQDYDYIDPHYGKIVSDGGETLKDGDTINAHASKYIKRVTDKANLESSNTFFVQLVEEIHRRGMKVILDGVFNHCGSFNNGWTVSRFMRIRKGMNRELMFPQTVLIAAFSNLITTRHGRTTRITMAGGDMIPCRSFAMSSHRSCTIIFWRSERNGFPRRSMSMAGDWMWLLTLDFPMNTTISSGKNSAKS